MWPELQGGRWGLGFAASPLPESFEAWGREMAPASVEMADLKS